MTSKEIPIITIDGPSGTGKGTISLKLANYLSWNFLDSGAIYRVLAYAVHQKNIDIDCVNTVIVCARNLDLKFTVDNELNNHVFLEGKEVTHDIRSEACGQLASKIAAIAEVREALLTRQRAFAKPPGLVTDGRDMGTVVFPSANLKLFLDASIKERAKRRYLQLKNKEKNVSLAQVEDDLASRDARDKARTHAPLQPAADAITIDTTDLTVVQVFDKVLQLVKKYIN